MVVWAIKHRQPPCQALHLPLDTGYALNLAGLRRQVDPHCKCEMSLLLIGLAALQTVLTVATVR